MLWGRLWLTATVTLIAIAALPQVASQATAALTLDPPVAAPGEPIVARFTTSGPVPIDLALQDHVTCVIAGPDGETAACDLRGDIVALRVASSITYTIPLVAPAGEGEHEVRVARAPLAQTTLMAAQAASSLSVVAPAPIEPSNATSEVDPTPSVIVNDHFWNVIFGSRDGAPVQPAANDAARWVASSSAGTATLVVLLVGSRFGGRP